MMGKREMGMLTLIGVICISALAQEQTKGTSRYTGIGEWIVVKGSLQDFTGKSDHRVADFATEAEATKEASRLNEVEKEWTKWTYVARRRASDDSRQAIPAVPSGGTGTTIKRPDLKFVDPGEMKKGEPKTPTLAGRTGSGAIGDYTITMTFTGAGENGDFTIGGGLQGKGKWRQLGKFVLMETGLSKFEGTLDGDKLIGNRRTKANGVKVGWSLDFSQPKNFYKTEDFVGTYQFSYRNGMTDFAERYNFGSDGRLTATTIINGQSFPKTYTWEYREADSSDRGGVFATEVGAKSFGIFFPIEQLNDGWYLMKSYNLNEKARLKKLSDH